MTFEALVRSDHAGNHFPHLAESWEFNEDGSAMTLRLREGVYFHNGEYFDADAVVFNFERLIEGRSTLGVAINFWQALESVEAIDQYNVRLNFDGPFSSALTSLKCTFMIPPGAFEEHGEALFNDQIMYGTGPWIFEEWVDGQFARFTKNTSYWNIANYDSYFNEVFIRYVVEPSSAVAAHLAGDVDAYIGIGGISADMVPLYAGAEDRIQVVNFLTSSFKYLHLSYREGSVFHDENVRWALVYGIDRQSISDNLLGGGPPVRSMFPQGVVGYDPTIEPYVFDPDRARQFLEDSTYDGRELLLLANSGSPSAESVNLAIADMLGQVGFNIVVRVEDSATFNTLRAAGEYDIFSIHSMYGDGNPFNHLTARILRDIHGSYFYDTEMFAVIEEFTIAMDPDERQRLAAQVNRMFRELPGPQTAYAVLYANQAINWGITGIDLFPDGFVGFNRVDWDPTLIP